MCTETRQRVPTQGRAQGLARRAQVEIAELPPGSAVVLNSALLHARRPRPGGHGRYRYFVGARARPLPRCSAAVLRLILYRPFPLNHPVYWYSRDFVSFSGI